MASSDTKQNGFAIRTFREMRGVSRDEFAKRLGLSYPYIANVENEHKDVARALLEKIALELEVPIKALLRRPLHDEAEKVPA